MTDDELRDSFGEDLTDALRSRSRVPPAGVTDVVIPRVARFATRRNLVAATLVVAVAVSGVSLLATRHHGAARIRVASPLSSIAATTTVPSSFQPLRSGVEDWTWVSDEQGWAVVRKQCGTKVCIGLRATVDGGRTWTSLPAPDALDGGAQSAANVACTARPCLSRVRFATSKIGWLFGPALFQTTDGGHTWQRTPSATVRDVEATNGVAMRITTTDRDCGGGCSYDIDRMRLGASTWQRDPSGPQYQFPSLLLQGSDAYEVIIPNWAGAGQSYLRVSKGAGTSWRSINDPCPGSPAYYRTASASAAPGGLLVVLCLSVDEASGTVRVSTDSGTTFGPRLRLPPIPLNTFGPIAAASAETIAIAYSDQQKYGVLVTNDGGMTWRPTLTPSEGPTRATTFTPTVGWQDAHTARASFNTNVIWTTRDGGRSWTQDRVTP